MSDLHIAPTGGDSLLGGGEERSTRDSAIVLVNLIGVCLAFTVVLLRIPPCKLQMQSLQTPTNKRDR